MTVVNLVPARRLEARRCRARLRLWCCIALLWCTALAGANLWASAAWLDDTEEVVASIKRTDAEILELERASITASAAIAEAHATLRARRAVGDQPDWGLLLATLAARTDQQGVFSSCILEPEGSMPGGDAGREASRKMIRPSRYTLGLTGLTRTQDAASNIAIALERTGIFEHVTLLEARRAAFLGQEVVSFRLECALVDPAAEVQ
jgi:hypothetical protein